MINMKRSKSAVKDDMKLSVCDEEIYPWGLRISLQEEDISKLGITKLPEAGAVIKLEALCNVSEVGSRDSMDGGKNRNLSLQITDLSLEEPKEEVNKVSKLYGE